MRNVVSTSIILSMLLATTAAQAAPNALEWRERYYSGEPMQIGNAVQFLFDDYIVEDRYGLTRIVGPVEKYDGNPLTIGAPTPWERASDSFGGANLRHVIYDPDAQMYKGWYVTYRVEQNAYRNDTSYNYDTLYAESRDGITWEKPALDFYPYNGEKTNTVLHVDGETALLEDILLDLEADDPARRFVALVKTVPPSETIRCIVRMHSPDGKAWTFAEDPVLFRGASDGAYSLVKDPARDQWLMYRRPPTRALENPEDPFYGERNNKRRFSVSASKDMKDWSYPRGIPMLDELDDARLEQVGNRMDIDWATAMTQEDVFFGFLSMLDNLKISVPVHCHLMWSRDGLDWKRLPARPNFIENGAPGDWDANSISVSSLIPQGDRFHLYYSGSNTTQSYYGREGEENIPEFRGTGLAFIGRNRFIGLQAGPEGGYLLTRQFVFDGDRIEVNIRPHVGNPPPGQESLIAAEILQPAEEHFKATPYSGFSFEDADPVPVTDAYNLPLTWKGSADLSALKGKPVYIRFNIKNATIYTFTAQRTGQSS